MKEEVVVMQNWLKSLEATPTIVALRQRAEQIKAAELEKIYGRLENLSDQERLAVEGMASALVNKLLHGSLVTLKSAAQSSNGSVYIEAARRFYYLEEPAYSLAIQEGDSASESRAVEDESDVETVIKRRSSSSPSDSSSHASGR